jgi:2-oxoglutarate ferredoxin oxidoreductase subunit beta
VVVHDAASDDPAYAFALSRLATAGVRHPTIGVLRSARRPTYDERFRSQLEAAEADGPHDLQRLLHGTDARMLSAPRSAGNPGT